MTNTSPRSFRPFKSNPLKSSALFITASLVVMASSATMASAQMPPMPEGFGHKIIMKIDKSADMLKKIDTNKDGSVDRAEFDADRAARFSSIDTDHNELLSETERAAHRKVKFADHKNERFAALDTNGDNFISKAEFNANTPDFDTLAAKKDAHTIITKEFREKRKEHKNRKKLSKKERKEMRKTMKKMRAKHGGKMGAKHMKLDGDSDGFISRAEFDAQGQRKFERMDFDKNGVINQADFEALKASPHKGGRHMRHIILKDG